MAHFSPELLFDLAKYADKDGEYLGSQDYRLPGDFEDCDKPKIDAFKDAIFMVIMLRAAKYMKLTGQEKHAFGHFGVLLYSSDVHEDESDDQEDFLNSKFTLSALLANMGPIPRKTIRSLLDDDISSEILDGFDSKSLMLACKNP